MGIDSVAAPPDDTPASTTRVIAFAPRVVEHAHNPQTPMITTVIRSLRWWGESLACESLAELIAYAKKNPGKVNFGSAGAGGITHLACELLKVEAGIDILHVPYKGAAPAVNDLLGGQVHMGIFDVPVVLSHIQSGKFRALAVTSAKRAPPLPDVPTTCLSWLPQGDLRQLVRLVAAAATLPQSSSAFTAPRAQALRPRSPSSSPR
jgi:tripartite-type tricarboxylate transporter receptor subunit TctC